MKIAVTGGSGYLGERLVSRLLRKGHEVLSIDRRGGMTRTQENYSEVLGDINGLDMGQVLRGTDLVIHLAANPDVRDSENNRVDTFGTTERVVDAMVSESVGRMVFVSSSAVYGISDGVLTEDSPCTPVSEYGTAKLDSERIVMDRISEWTVVRFANLCGRRVVRGVVHDFFRKLQGSDELEILGDGNQVREYLHVDDAVSAILHLMDNNLTGVYNVGNGDPISVIDVARTVTETMGKDDISVSTQSSDVGWVGDIPAVRMSSEKIRSTGWTPRYGSEESVSDATRTLMIASQFE